MEISETERQRRAQQSKQDKQAYMRDKLAYTIPELVCASGAGRSKIYQEIAAGRLKVKKLGKRTIALRGDAVAWLEALPAA